MSRPVVRKELVRLKTGLFLIVTIDGAVADVTEAKSLRQVDKFFKIVEEYQKGGCQWVRQNG